MQKLYQEIYDKCKPLHYEYKIAGIGKLMDNEELKIAEAELK